MNATDDPIEFTEFELETLHTFLSTQVNVPDVWPNATSHEMRALGRVLSKLSKARNELELRAARDAATATRRVMRTRRDRS
jgi:hypothetical protein